MGMNLAGEAHREAERRTSITAVGYDRCLRAQKYSFNNLNSAKRTEKSEWNNLTEACGKIWAASKHLRTFSSAQVSAVSLRPVVYFARCLQ